MSVNEKDSVNYIISKTLPDNITSFIAINKVGYAENVIKSDDEYECYIDDKKAKEVANYE